MPARLAPIGHADKNSTVRSTQDANPSGSGCRQTGQYASLRVAFGTFSRMAKTEVSGLNSVRNPYGERQNR